MASALTPAGFEHPGAQRAADDDQLLVRLGEVDGHLGAATGSLEKAIAVGPLKRSASPSYLRARTRARRASRFLVTLKRRRPPASSAAGPIIFGHVRPLWRVMTTSRGLREGAVQGGDQLLLFRAFHRLLRLPWPLRQPSERRAGRCDLDPRVEPGVRLTCPRSSSPCRRPARAEGWLPTPVSCRRCFAPLCR